MKANAPVKKLLLALLVVIVLAGAAGALFYWKAAQGVPPEKLEANYMTPSDRFVDIDGARVRIREEGPPTATPVILLHGFIFSLESWDSWAQILAKDYRVIRYDLLGHGLTGPDPKERYAPQERAAFLGEVMDALEIHSAVIGGNSLGGLAAWRFAAANPDRIDALILVSPGAYSINNVTDQPVEVPAAMKAFLLTAPEAGVRSTAAFVYADDSKITGQRVKTLRDMMRRKGNGQAFVKSLEKFTLPDPTEDLARVAAPTLILWGEKDLLIPPEHGRRMESAISDARLITYPGVGHAAQEEAPAASAVDAISFIESVRARREADAE